MGVLKPLQESNSNSIIKSPHQSSNSGGEPFRRPVLFAPSLFDPSLLLAFQNTLLLLQSQSQSHSHSLPNPNNLCPPGGADAVVIYTTSLRAVRKTFDDCVLLRRLLKTLNIAFFDRDVSLHAAYRDHLRSLLGDPIPPPPRVFIRGAYVGGAEEVVGMHERGELVKLVPRVEEVVVRVCWACGGFRFLVCCDCHGRRRRWCDQEMREVHCRRCNENGLIVCPLCLSSSSSSSSSVFD